MLFGVVGCMDKGSAKLILQEVQITGAEGSNCSTFSTYGSLRNIKETCVYFKIESLASGVRIRTI